MNGSVCPIPLEPVGRILMGHGSGGTLSHRLIEEIFLPAFGNAALDARHDGATLPPVPAGRRLAFTTDSYVVRPLFFPGGDIGSLAVHGTVNDLAMCGARPLYLSAGFILEEGLEIATLARVAASMAAAARTASVSIVTGDTKVTDRGKGDGIYINTSGVGILEHDLPIGPASVRAGDVVILSGDIGRHGMAILAVREGLAFESEIESDSAPLHAPVLALLAAGVEVRCLRDLTRGGLTSALCEIAEVAACGIELDESAIAIRPDVLSACEILGLDPFYVANEGRFVAFVPVAAAAATLAVLRANPATADAVAIGRTTAGGVGEVRLRSPFGTARVLDRLSGDQLPRIC